MLRGSGNSVSRSTRGLQAIEWTADERGLAGVSDLEGIPWTMPMNEFFGGRYCAAQW